MAVAPIRKRLALDSNVLFDLAQGADFARALLKTLRTRGFSLFVTPTVVQELVLIATETREQESKQRLASIALRTLRDWGITPYDLLSVGHGITEQFAKHLIRKGLLPINELNDGQILAETALAEVPGLVTSDRHLLDIENAALQAALKERDLPAVMICHPKNLLRSLDQRL